MSRLTRSAFGLLCSLILVSSTAEGLYGARAKRKLTAKTERLWLRMPILYKVAPGVNKGAVERGIEMWERQTCVRFKEAKNIGKDDHYVEFIPDGWKCYSSVGKQGEKRQDISIGIGCGRSGVVAHEIGHTLGLWHEHARPDRDRYIRVLPENLRHTHRMSNFIKWTSKEVKTDLPYDLGSVMHYDGDSFSQPGKHTIETKDPAYQNTIGQRFELSFIDVKTINQAYCNHHCSQVLSCENGGYEDPLDCSRCKCPKGLTGKRCDTVQARGQCLSARQPITSCMMFEKGIPFARELKNICPRGGKHSFQASEGQQIEIRIKRATFDCVTPCNKAHLEVRYLSMETTGARICCDDMSQPLLRSRANKVLIEYHGLPFTGFQLTYRLSNAHHETNWSRWSQCTHSCGSCGTQVRSRCIDSACRKARKERRSCGSTPCPTLANCQGFSCRACCIPFEKVKDECKLQQQY